MIPSGGITRQYFSCPLSPTVITLPNPTMHSYWKSLKITIHLYYGWAFNDDCPKEHLPLHRTCGLQWSGARLCVMTRSRQKTPRKWPHLHRNWGAIKFSTRIPRNPRVVLVFTYKPYIPNNFKPGIPLFFWIFFLSFSDRNLLVLAPIWSNQISCRLNRSLLGFSTVAYQVFYKWKSRGFLVEFWQFIVWVRLKVEFSWIFFAPAHPKGLWNSHLGSCPFPL